MLQKFSDYAILPTVCLLFFSFATKAQKRHLRGRAPVQKTQKQPKTLSSAKYRTPVPAVVIEEKLAVLRFESHTYKTSTNKTKK
jgi:hypothetical protein